MEKSDEEEENVPESYDGDDLLNMLQSNEDTENSQNDECDLPLIESKAIDNQDVDNSAPRVHIFSGLLDKLKDIWKK
ncbi:unnamed protein product [Parnassius apollo]|uniref:(apollo) hypothetical protein n=1 Tax=Parnassius apollo TaxID=110799 RepID=A0A8S3WZ09_PARAO|nr:unnamed protein product [Parnassius apollo]